MYEIQSSNPTETRALRETHSILGANKGNLQLGQIAKGEDIFTYPSDDVVDGVLRAKAGDQWIHVFEMNGITADGWMAITHLGVVYTLLTEIVMPPGDSIRVTIDITADINGKLYGGVVENIELLPK